MNNRKELIVFFSITFLVTWIIWIPPVLNGLDMEVPIFLLIISNIASFTPTIAGLILGRRYLGKRAFKASLKDTVNFRFNKWWLLVLTVLFVFMAALSLQIFLMTGGRVDVSTAPPLVFFPLVFLQILLIGGALGEEFGWRWFAYPRMEALMGPMLATLVLGVLWSLWHLPLFFMVGTVQSNMPIWQFMVQNTLIAFFYTWVYGQTKGNMVLMIFLHAIANTSAAVFPYWQTDTGRFIGLGVLLVGLLMTKFIKLKHFDYLKPGSNG